MTGLMVLALCLCMIGGATLVVCFSGVLLGVCACTLRFYNQPGNTLKAQIAVAFLVIVLLMWLAGLVSVLGRFTYELASTLLPHVALHGFQP